MDDFKPIQWTPDQATSNLASVRRTAWRLFLPAGAVLSAVLVALALPVLAVLVDRELRQLEAAERQVVAAGAASIRDRLRALGEDARFLASRHVTLDVARAPGPQGRDRLAAEFVDFARGRRVYDQVRLLDAGGRELVRVNWNGGRPAAVPDAELQDKRDRYYFTDAIGLGQGALYLSPLDLNVERGAVEVPHKPMIRVATPVFTDGEAPRGVVVLNYLAQELLSALEAEARAAAGRLVLLDQEGRWLRSPVDGQAFSFMFGRADQFGADHADAWRRMSGADGGQFTGEDGLWTHATVHPLGEWFSTSLGTAAPSGPSTGDLSHHAYRWTVATLVPAAALADVRWRAAGLVALGWGLAWMAALWGAARWAVLRARRDAAEAALRDERELLSAVLGSMAEGLLIHDGTGRVVAANAAAGRILGLPVERLVGLDGLTPVGPALDEGGQPVAATELPAACAIRQDLATPRRRLSVPRPDGGSAFIDVTAVPLALRGSAADRGAVTTFSDATLQRELLQRMALSAQLASLGTLASGAAHEINNPLAVIVCNLSHLAGELDAVPSAADLREATSDALDSAHRVRDIVASLQAFASRGHQVQGDASDVRGAVDVALRLTRGRIEARARLEVSVPDRLPPVLTGAGALGQVLVNLLANAADAIPAGDPARHLVRLAVSTVEGDVVIEVRDSGVGIPAADLPRLFDPFFTTKVVGRGVGLGLSLCYGLVREAGGRIEVDSTPGCGSAFRVVMPVSVARPGEAVLA